MIKIIRYTSNKVEKIEYQELLELEISPKENVWVCLENPTQIEEEQIFHKFDIHPLTVDDSRRAKFIGSLKRHQHKPKIEDYDKYLFVVFHKIEAIKNEINFNQKQLNTFLGKNFIITLTYEKFKSIDIVFNMIEKSPELIKKGPDFIFHLVIDEIVDNALDFLENIESEINKIESDLFRNIQKNTLNSIWEVKKQLNLFRRTVFYQKDILFRLSRGEFSLITKGEAFYYRNVYDHLMRAWDLTESYREMMLGLMDAYHSITANKLNEIMKVLTIICTIIMPLSFIAGIYGMNFEIMPELKWKYGYPFALFLMLFIVIAMLIFFKKKKWF
jgi:magnesium transporter